jgi:hypothetical protein
MAGRITLDLTRLSGVDLRSRSHIVRMPHYVPPAWGEQTALKAGLATVASSPSRNSGIAKDILSLQDGSKRVSLRVIGAPPPPTPGPTSLYMPRHDLTIGWGWGVSVSALVMTGQIGAGLYLWLPRCEIGVYGTGGLGPTLFATGFSGNVVVTILNGPAPTVLGGYSILTGFDIGGAPTGGLSFGFALVWSLKWVLEGCCFNLGAGMSANWLSFDVYYEVSATWVKPIYR